MQRRPDAFRGASRRQERKKTVTVTSELQVGDVIYVMLAIKAAMLPERV